MAIGYGFWDTRSEVPMSVVISVRGVVPMDVSSLANWEAYCFRSASTLDSVFGLSLWWGGWKVSSCTCSAIIFWSDTICWVSIWLTLGMCIICHTIFYGGFEASCVFSFVKFNVFVCVIRHQNIDRCFPFYVLDAIDYVCIWVSSFCGVLISEKVSQMFLNCLTCDLNWCNTIVSRWYFECQFNNTYCCLLFTVSWICKELPSICNSFCLCPTYRKLRTSSECQFQKLSPCLTNVAKDIIMCKFRISYFQV